MEATTSCTSTSPHGGYNGGKNLFLSLTHSHSIHKSALYTYNYKSVQQPQTIFALSHIYTHMTFGLFTHMAPRGSLERIHVCVPSNRLREVTTGPLVIRFFSRPIRRDLFPNQLPLHSGMGCRVSLIRCRHASSLSGVRTLVSMSDPFSAV